MKPTIETFRTVIPLFKFPFAVSHSHRLLCIGSCFAERIGEMLAERKFNILINPSGILFNPLSVAECLNLLTKETEIGEERLFFHEGCWHSFDFHSRFSNPDKVVCLQQMRDSLREGREFLRKTDFLLLTLGSNVVYRLKQDGRVAANCHKMPAQSFDRQMLSVDEAAAGLEQALQRVKAIRPDLRCILTVSPVRYLGNDFSENSLSKASLRLVCQRLTEHVGGTFYFPAYEIMTDDLRDYRFYATDRIHPSDEAVAYIWQCFSSVAFSEETIALNRRIEALTAAMRHRPAFPQSEAFLYFRQHWQEELAHLRTEYPMLDFTAEERHFFQDVSSSYSDFMRVVVT
ncbi:MAG: GSCFA domain-containing protein [Bacteroidales bacterium]|nr:GSCFA domain-containing protein [Bacteroidales bacterium]